MTGDMGHMVCDSCKILTLDIFSGAFRFSVRWETIQSHYAELSYFLNHLDGTIESLQISVQHGCQLCKLIYEKTKVSGATSVYCLFLWRMPPEQCKLQITTRPIREFIEPISQRKPPPELEFFQLRPTELNHTEGSKGAESSKDKPPPLSQLPNPDPNSEEAVQQALSWLRTCQNEHDHPACKRPYSHLPKRVIDLRRMESEGKVELYITKKEQEPYIAFSYSWGETKKLVLQAIDNEHPPAPDAGDSEMARRYVVEHKKPLPPLPDEKHRFECLSRHRPDDIPVDKFPISSQDALRLASRLGFRYVWVDALGIVQNSDADWAEEGAAMTNIYGMSTLNISASSNEDSSQRFLNSKPTTKVRIGTAKHGGPASDDLEIYVGEPQSTLDLEKEFLATRGWVFQERLVSTATLHYTNKGMVWECISGTFLDHDQHVSTAGWKKRWRATMDAAPIEDTKVKELSNVPYEIWYEWICAYSARDLYDPADKFTAIAGVANHFAQAFGLGPSSYKAGLWKEDFLRGLLWRRHQRAITLTRYEENTVAPSWSWAAFAGRLNHRNLVLCDAKKKGPKLEILDIVIHEKVSDQFGKLLKNKISCMVVDGWIQQVTIDRHTHPGVRQRAHQECGVIGFANDSNVLCMLDEYNEQEDQKQENRYHECWCLRIGSYDWYGREADVFLLLDMIDPVKALFRRIGLAETDVWATVHQSRKLIVDSGVLPGGELKRLTVK